MSLHATVASAGDGSVLLYGADRQLRELYQLLLHADGCAVTVCDSLAEVLQGALTNPANLALIDDWGSSDLDLQEQDRQEICAFAQQVPTIMITAHSWA